MSAPQRQLTLFDTTCILVGIIIGAGIYETTPLIAANVGGTWQLIGVWLLGGVAALIGSLCYAELTSAYPRDGGDYVFLTAAFGRRVGFLFAWAEFWIIRPGSVGMMAFVFGRYAQKLWPLNLSGNERLVFAVVSVVVLSVLNLLGVRAGKITQNVLTTIKVLGLLGIFAAGTLFAPGSAAEPIVESATQTNYSLAMIFVLFTYGGWNEMSYVAAEVRDPNRNVLRSLVIGAVAVCVIYVLVNLAFVKTLGFSRVASSQALAADTIREVFGERLSHAASALICVSCLGAVNAMLFTGSRVLYAAGLEHRIYRWLGRWNDRLDAPVHALCLQLAVTCGLILGFGRNEDGFRRLLDLVNPVFWTFTSLVAVSVIVLRITQPQRERPYRVFWFPLPPLVFLAFSVFLAYSSLMYVLGQGGNEIYFDAAILLAGLAASFVDPGT